jgi:exodeoxyribonuclease-3
MRIVAWNCNTALHKKFQHLAMLKPDVAVASECEQLGFLSGNRHVYPPSSTVWIGDNPRKGLGVITFGPYSATLSPEYRPDIPYFAPVRIEGPVSFNLLGVWACHNKPNSYVHRIAPTRRAVRAYQRFLASDPSVVAGDFNDNVRFPPHRGNTHWMAVEELGALGLTSAYDHTRNVAQGGELESEPTIYWRDRTLEGPRYHIDYCFVPHRWLNGASVVVGAFEDWISVSDHVPLVVDLNDVC